MLWQIEKKALNEGFKIIAGVDEAGRGPLAGPVVSAAVILPTDFPILILKDSKKLSHKQRLNFYQDIYKHAISIGIGIVDAIEIDRINILQASLLSMLIAIDNLSPKPDCALIDGKFKTKLNIYQKAIIKGDELSISIASASIIAKVTRDKLMEKYSEVYPQFGFEQHKGYPTKAHKQAIYKFGTCLIHRKTFKHT